MIVEKNSNLIQKILSRKKEFKLTLSGYLFFTSCFFDTVRKRKEKEKLGRYKPKDCMESFINI